ncbi:NDP-sugar synthase [Patescibacteria group bacterium]|nr:NDP-sugar synthase [Patescibacteria group bacterium]
MRECIILAGGLGKRMENDLPKWVTPIGKDTTIAQYQLEWLVKNGVKQVFVTVNRQFWLPNMNWVTIIPRNLRVSVNLQFTIEEEPIGDEAGLKRALGWFKEDIVEEDILVVNCDILTDLDLSLLPTAPALVVVHPRSPWGVLEETTTRPGKQVAETIYEYTGPEVTTYSLQEKPILPILVSSGIYYFSKSIKNELVDNGMLAENIIPKLMKKGRLNIYKHDGLWHAIETPKDLEEASRILDERDLP